MLFFASFVAAAVLAVVHIFAGRLRTLGSIPRSRWLSGAGGVAVAYVFIHILPELSEAQHTVSQAAPAVLFLEHHAYLIAMGGLMAFYGLEHWVKQWRRKKHDHADASQTGVFWVHVLSFAAYNGLVGYLLVQQQDDGLHTMIAFAVAMGLHFVVNDFALRQEHRDAYHRIGRWLLAGAVVAGWLVGRYVPLPDAAVAILFAFLAGGVILNTLKEELPEERQSNFAAFLFGAGSYAAVLLFA